MRVSAALYLAFLVVGAGHVPVAAQTRSFHEMTTGNGHGFQVFDRAQNRITFFSETANRWLAPPDAARKQRVDGRNLAHDIYFGVRAANNTTWLHDQTDVAYEAETHIIRGRSTQDGVLTETYYFAPFGLPANGMVMLVRAQNVGGGTADVSLFAKPNLRLGTGRPDPSNAGETVNWNGTYAVETGPGGGHAIYVPVGGVDAAGCGGDTAIYNAVRNSGTPGNQSECSGNDQVIAFQKNVTLAPGESASWGLGVLFLNDNPSHPVADSFRDHRSIEDMTGAFSAYVNGRSPQALHDDELTSFEAWRAPVPEGLSAKEVALWRQSETVMRMGQVREPDQSNRTIHGAFLAAIPPGTLENNYRFSWYVPWVRDGAYAVVAAAMIGHLEEAKLGLGFMFNADNSFFQPARDKWSGTGFPYRISATRYYGNGLEEGDWDENGYNFETDGWGLVLWAAGAIVREDPEGACAWLNETTGRGDTNYAALVEVATDIEEQLQINGDLYLPIEEASIWEVHTDYAKVFTFTAISQIRGLYDFAMIADAIGDTARAEHFRFLADKMRESMFKVLVNQNDQSLAGNLTNAGTPDHHDGAVIEGLNWGLVPTDNPVYQGTLSAMDVLKVNGVGYVRLTQASHPQGPERYNAGYDGREWAVLDLAASEAFRRIGNSSAADPLLDRVTNLAAVNDNLISELYGVGPEAGVYRGSPPMVGYGAGAWMRVLLDREGKPMPHYSEGIASCMGDVPDVPDGGLGGTDAGPITGGGDGGPTGPSAGGALGGGPACLCTVPVGTSVPAPLSLLFSGVVIALLLRRRR